MANLTAKEVEELEELLAEKERRDALNPNNPDLNPNFLFLTKSLLEQEYEVNPSTKELELVKGFGGCVLEGSARSGKTYSWIMLIIYICLKIEKKCIINIFRATYNEIKTTLYPDFQKILDFFNLPNPFSHKQEIHSFKIGENTINFIGADGVSVNSKANKQHGAGSDYCFFNEGLFISQSVFNHAIMRCSKFWVMDYNPSVTEHWVFSNVLKRHDVGFLRTTFRDNKFCPPKQKHEILITEPWLPNSYEVVDNKYIYYNGKEVDENNQPPPHPINIEQGTADEFSWRVYGLGLRGAMKGLIFRNVKYIDSFPEHLAYSYGLDFGFTSDPTALTKNAEDETTIYIELLLYQPVPTPEELDEIFQTIGVDHYTPISADSSDKYTSEANGTIEMVRALFDLGYEIHKVQKTKSVMFHLNRMTKKRICVVKNHLVRYAQTEFENYRLKEIHGISINQPIDKFNHCIDSARYRKMSFDVDDV